MGPDYAVDPATITEDERAVATALHDLQCRASHIDQCGWEYESWTQPRWARTGYAWRARKFLERCRNNNIKKAKALLTLVDAETAVEIMRLIREIEND